MPHANIWIRKENEVAWSNLKDKSAWVNAHLSRNNQIKQQNLNERTQAKIDDIKEKLYPSTPIVVCRMHHLPVEEGRRTCMTKGCK